MKKTNYIRLALAFIFLLSYTFVCSIIIYTPTQINAAEISVTTTQIETTNAETTSRTITIKPEIKCNKTTYTMYPGQKISPTFQFIDVSTEEITYSSNKPKVVEFKNGIITAKKKGTATLTVKAANCSTLKIKIKVKKAIKSINFYQSSIKINKKDKRTINININRNGSTEPVKWSSSNPKIVTVNKNGKITGKKNGTAYIYCQSKYSKKKDRIKVYVKKTRYIAFTFDDGPGIYTDDLLDTLDKYNSKATFFVVGNRLNSYSNILKREYNEGHEIGNHSYTHPKLSSLSYKEISKEFKQTRKLINKYTSDTPTVTRPPYGAHNSDVTKAAKTPVILWSVDTLDWKYRDSDYVKKTILSNASDGEIVLLHDIHKTSVEGFKKAVKQLKKDGYELVTVSELFEIKKKSFKDGKIYYYCK